jgi:formylglycine-generating enzyme required for sulfatase activity
MKRHITNLVAVFVLLTGYLPMGVAGKDSSPAVHDQAFVSVRGGTLPVSGADPAISVEPFALCAGELTWAQWAPVREWAVKNGYEIGPGNAESSGHPVSAITWYDAVKFCNAASELAGLQPVYYADAAHTQVYRKGKVDLKEEHCKDGADGYRLPTEWEWEFAARAGTTTKYYYGDSSEATVHNPYAWHTSYTARGIEVSPHPVGLKKPNSLGLYDVSGNVAEWTWSRFISEAEWRVTRGGSVALDSDVTSGFRSPVPPGYRIYDVGMRLASSSLSVPSLAQVVAEKQLPMPVEREPLKPTYDATSDAEVARALVAILDPAYPANAEILRLQAQGEYAEALKVFRDNWVAHLGALSLKVKDKAKTPEEMATWSAETEQYVQKGKTEFDNFDNTGRASIGYQHQAVTWDWGMGFYGPHTGWYKTILAYVRRQPVDFSALPPRALANMAIFMATDGIARQLKDPRNIVGNQQIGMAKMLIIFARVLPHARDAAAWDNLGVERLKHGSLVKFIMPDGGDLEQSFNYNTYLPQVAEEIDELFEGLPKPDWVAGLRDSTEKRQRMFGALRHASGTWPSVGNNSYGRDLRDKPRNATDKDFDSLLASIEDRLLFEGSGKLSVPAFTSIAFPYSGYYMMRNGWDNQSSSLFFKSSRPGAGHNHPDNNSIELVSYGRHLLVDRESPPYDTTHLNDAQKEDFLFIHEYKREESARTANGVVIDGFEQRPGFNPEGYKDTIPGQYWYTSPHYDYVQGAWTREFAQPKPINLDELRLLLEKHNVQPAEVAKRMELAASLNAERKAPPFKARHVRQIIYVKEANAWIVTDWINRLDGKEAQTITQHWNLPSPALRSSGAFKGRYKGVNPLAPGFSRDQIRVDAGKGMVYTENPNNVNLALFNAPVKGAKYQIYYGDKYPYRGWANASPSMVSVLVPAVDIEASFPAGGPLVTVLVPIPQGETLSQRVTDVSQQTSGNRTTVEISFGSGVSLSYQVETSGVALLAVTGSGQTTTGIAINEDGGGNTYEMKDGKQQNTATFTVPTGFIWKKTAEGDVPVY